MFSFSTTRVLLAGVSICIAVGQSSAIIVDALGAFESKRPGWSVSMRAGISAQGGNTELLEVAGGAQAQWQGHRDRIRFMGGYSRQTSDSREIAEDALLHLRHNRQLAGAVHSLAFAQVQRNPFQRLRSRTLLGLGGRIDLLESEARDAALGLAHMVELERLEGEPDSDADQRLSSFLVARFRLSATANLSLAIYAQPLWSDFADLRATGSAKLSVPLTEQLSLELGGSFQHDSRPPDAVEETDWSTSTGLKFEF